MPADSYASVAHYDAILLLDCFGALIPHFNTDRLLVARRRFPFNMTRNMHESEFYLMCAKEFLGVPYTTEDAAKYFFGNLTMQGEKRRVGVHAGCKTGVWMAKRWPYFEELVARLQSDGFEVCSFGSADEYVEGTTNWTATDLETTARNIASCGYFVANDSGLMHIADALEIPLTTIFAPTSVVKNGPLKATSRVVKIQKDCSPCQFDANKLEQCTCIAEISLEEVYEAVKADLRADDASDGVQASRYQA